MIGNEVIGQKLGQIELITIELIRTVQFRAYYNKTRLVLLCRTYLSTNVEN